MRKNTLFNFGLLLTIVYLLGTIIIGWYNLSVDLLPDQGASWYYWKLIDPHFITTIFIWLLYFFHQIIIWYLIYRIKQNPNPIMQKKLLFINGLFIIFHLIQSYFLYDGLGQYAPIYSSQGSVILLLVIVLIMKIKKRGLFFGYNPFHKISNLTKIIDLCRKYHPYVFSWAIIYTFWFHPIVLTVGHIVGFLYLYLLMIQLALPLNKIHYNSYWTVFLEVFVTIHAFIIALEQKNNLWTMFLFGFLTIFVITQMYELGLKKKTRRIIQVFYLILITIVYSGFVPNYLVYDLHQVLWIPFIEYLLVFVIILILSIGYIIKNNILNKEK